jgi:hypothetical protein
MKGAYRQLFWLVLILSCALENQAQEDRFSERLSYDFRLNQAAFRAHRPEMFLPNDFFYNFDIGLTYHSTGEKAWSYTNNLPRVGLRYAYFHFPDDELMGRGHALYTNLSNDFFRSNRHSFFYDLGMGLGWVTRTFDPVENPLQNAMSSRLNVYVDARAGYRFHWNGAWSLGVQLFHFSNAANRKPNSGMNFFGYFIGYSTAFPTRNFPSDPEKLKMNEKRDHQLLVGGLISQHQHSYQDPHDFIANVFVEKNFQLSRNYRLGIGGQVFYEAYEKIYHRWARKWGNQEIREANWTEGVSTGIYISNEWVLDRFSIFLHKGVYTSGNFREFTTIADYAEGGIFEHRIRFNQSVFFHRLGYRYKINNHLTAQLSMLTHFAKARYTEIGIVYRL